MAASDLGHDPMEVIRTQSYWPPCLVRHHGSLWRGYPCDHCRKLGRECLPHVGAKYCESCARRKTSDAKMTEASGHCGLLSMDILTQHS